jgi:hypothetical protein
MHRRVWIALLLSVSGCAPTGLDEVIAETEVDGPFEALPEDEKFDGTAGRGPRVSAGTDTEVWAVTNQWADTTTTAARRAGIAWGENSGLDWEAKFEAWVSSFETEPRAEGTGQTFVMTTPYGERSFHAPTLECAEVAMFLRATFASWYHLPFYISGWDATSRQAMYAGHFGFINSTGARVGNFPRFKSSYRDHESSWRAGQTWPSDSRLRGMRLGDDDAIEFLSTDGTTRGAGAYFDEIFLNKRVGYFMRLLLLYHGSANLADGANTYNVQPEAIAPGDILVERWQRRGIGHVLPVFRVTRHSETAIEVSVASGSMPRREPVWEEPSSARHNFLAESAGGPGVNTAGEEYARLGGGLRRWRTPVLRSGKWANDVALADRPAFINDQDYAAIAARPARFDEILHTPSPEEQRMVAVQRIEAAREHLRAHPASCSARERREDAFRALYELDGDRASVDAEYRTLEDYVFGALVYTQSKTCCWNSTTTAMAEIVMDYAETEQRNATARGMCVEPTVFRSERNGYERWRAHAASLGRAAQWVAWSEDESCAQRAVAEDTVDAARAATPFCSLDSVTPNTSGCDATAGATRSAATAIAPGATRMARVCASDEDWYRIDATRSVTVRISFTHSAGDLDMQAVAADGRVLSSSDGTANTESVTATGPFYVRVHGYNGAANAYTITAQ